MTKVLVVDDDTDLLEMVSLVLTSHGMAVTALGCCLHFNEYITRDTPDIVLMDIYLGDCDGRDLCRELKMNEGLSHIPIILYSAGNITSTSIEISLANDFMAKPFDIHQLLKKINHTLAIGRP